MTSKSVVVVFSKSARPGRVKTRLIGDLSAEAAAELHGAFLGDLLERLARGTFDLRLAWSLGDGEEAPLTPYPCFRQTGCDLGERLMNGLHMVAGEYPFVAAVGSDHPELSLGVVHDAFATLEQGAPIVLGPAHDGGYYLIAVRRESLDYRLFSEIPWSSDRVLATTLERCAELSLEATLLPPAGDVDTPADLERLTKSLERGAVSCPRTEALLRAWGRLTPA